VLTFNDQRYSTQAISKTVNPTWNAVFDVTITQGERSEVIEAVCWDRDRFSKKYLGEFGLSIAEIFPDGVVSLYDPSNQVELMF
jgi:phosphatidylserine decarboxylase